MHPMTSLRAWVVHQIDKIIKRQRHHRVTLLMYSLFSLKEQIVPNVHIVHCTEVSTC